MTQQPIEDEPDDLPDLPAGYVRVTRPGRSVPKKRKASVWWGVAGFVAVAAAAVLVIVLVSLPDPQDEADTTAQAVADALTAHDLDGVSSLLCEHAARSPEITAFYQSYGNASVLAVEDLGSGFANATLRSADRPGIDLVLQMSMEDDSWCVFGPVPCEVMDSGSAGLPPADVCEKRPRA
ncbi:hypothetical protein [Labedaea rhizosphaerae]|nr:hypothetical protein [Labedaea rhizosphaerae]